jgi:outer membrane receptor protein involved in Fe transport
MRLGVIGAAVCLSIIGLSQAGDVRASMVREPTNIPPQSLGPALQALAKDRDFQIVYVSEEVNSLRTQGAVGEFTPDEALKQLLKGTGLTYRYVDGKTVAIVTASSGSTSSSNPPSTATSGGVQKEGQNPAAETFLVAQATQGQTSSAASVVGPAAVENQLPTSLQEVLVTAQKRSERAQDVPVPVTVISGGELLAQNTVRLQDYSSEIPGLSVSTSSVGGYQLLSIRGLTTGLANPTVGITIDDVPFGSSTVNGGNIPPDVDPGELARVEVLRGPQGTLYGASSIGGLIKFVTIDPSTKGISGDIQAGTSVVSNGAELGYNFRGAVNVPLSDTFAVRLSGFDRQDPGYIDNPTLHIDGINKINAYGGHLTALWQPAQSFSLKLSALIQETKANGSPDITNSEIAASIGYPLPPLGDLQQDYIPGAGKYETRIQAYSATARATLGSGELTSITGYNINTYYSALDFSYALGPFVQAEFGVPGVLYPSSANIEKFTQELRYSVQLGKSVDWLLGGFYTHEDAPFTATLLGEDPTTGVIAGEFGRFEFANSYRELAAFTDFTFHIQQHFDIQLGGRESQIKQTYQETDSGPYVPLFEGVPSPNVGPTGESQANAFTYLLTPRFTLSPDFMMYARLASGYRAGGPNVGTGVPPEYSPDKTYNYEIGAKGDALNHTLSFDASLFYIDWKDIQVENFNEATGADYVTNAGGAKSQGIELSVQSVPVTGLKLAAWVVWNDAVLTKPFPPASVAAGTYGVAGDRLPYAMRISGNASADWDFIVARGWTATIGGSFIYVGDRVGPFQGTATRQEYPGYAQINLRAGLRYNLWTADLFVTNLTNKRGLIDGGLGTNIPYDFHYLQPVTVGLNLSRRF